MASRLLTPILFVVAMALIFSAYFLAVPVASAAGVISQCTGLNCELCHIFELIDNIIQYAILVGASLAAIGFAIAGVMIFVSQGDTTKIARAKTIFKTVFFGYVIALTGVLVIETIVRSLAAGEVSWKGVNCIGFGPGGRLLDGQLRFGPSTVCNNTSPEGCTETVNPEYSPVISAGGCSRQQMAATFGEAQADVMSCVCGRESSGGNVGSGIDVMWNVPLSSVPPQYQAQVDAWRAAGALRYGSTDLMPFSWGVFQINLAAHNITCQGRTLNCSQAFTTQDAGARDWTSFIPRGVSADVIRVSPQAVGSLGYGRVVRDWSTFTQCVNMALDRACNLEYAARIARGSGIAGPWSASYAACQQQVAGRR